MLMQKKGGGVSYGAGLLGAVVGAVCGVSVMAVRQLGRDKNARVSQDKR